MSIAGCTTAVPTPNNPDCGTPDTSNGGIGSFVVADCDIETTITDPTNASQWEAAYLAGLVQKKNDIVGSIAAPSDTTLNTKSCGPDAVVQRQRTITAIDYHQPLEETTTDFYNTLNNNANGFLFGYITCDGKFLGWISEANSNFARLHDDSKVGTTRWEGTIIYDMLDEIVPVDMPSVSF